MNELIGNTPMIKIKYKYENKIDYVYVKLEYYNLTGSIKDRMVYYILDKAKNDKILEENMPIIEATSGNTGISIASYGALHNHPVYIFMPDFVSIERKKLMEMYGGKVITYSKEEGGFLKCISEAEKLAKATNGFLVNQFSNPNNILAHYNGTGKEIYQKLKKVDAFVSGIGTGGTLIGTGKYLKEKCNSKIIALEPLTMAILTNGIKTEHKIEGIGDEFIPEIVDQSIIDDIVLVSDLEAINMSLKIARELGIGVGISAGANLYAAILSNNHDVVVTIFPDDNKKYLSTNLKLDQNTKLLSNKIKLLSYEIV